MSTAARQARRDFVDPFGVSADPSRYVAREATERALEALLRTVGDEGRSALLHGIPGIGKTLMLRLVGVRAAPGLRSLYLPYPSMPAAALCAWALELLEQPPSYDPVGALVAYAGRPDEQAEGLVLLIDDADSMPEDTAHQLVAAARESKGALRLVVAANSAEEDGVGEAFRDAEYVPLLEPMSEQETSAYVRAHLRAVESAGSARVAFDSASMAELHERARGIPGRVNAEASAILRKTLARSEAPGAAATAAARANEGDAAFERAAGLLTLAHDQPPGQAGGADEGFQRAAERLAEVHAAEAADRAVASSAAPEKPTAAAGATQPKPRPQRPAQPAAAVGAKPAPQPAAAVGAKPAPQPAAAVGAKPAPQPAAAVGAKPAPQPAAAVTAKRGVPRPAEAAAKRAAQPGVSWRHGAAVLGVFFALGAAVGIALVRERVPAAAPATSAVSPGPERVTGAPAASPGAAAQAAPAPETVPVQINADPWATIRVDGREVGITPLAGVPLTPGPHAFEAELPDGRKIERVQVVSEVDRFIVFP